MAAQSNRFPAFVTDVYQPGNGFAEFERAAQATGERTRRHFESSFDDIKRIAQQALTMPRNAGGSLDLNVGQYQAAATAANAHAAALREIATAAARAARTNGDNSQATRIYVQAARAAAIESEGVARAANQEAAAMERLQTELNQTASRTQAMVSGQRGLTTALGANTNSARASRFAMVQVGQQLQDVAIQAQMGTSALTILVQQGSQLGFAMSQMTGKAAAFGRLIAGPWGTAIFLGIAAIGYLTAALFKNKDAADAAKAGADGLSDAQGVLGEMFDLTSGKLKKQNDLLTLNARLTALNLRAEASAQRESSRETLGSAGVEGAVGRLGVLTGGVRGFIASESLTRRAKAQEDLLRNVTSKKVTLEEALQQTENMDFSGLVVGRKEFQQALIDQVSAAYKEETARLIDQSLDTGTLAPGLRRDKKGGDHADEIANLENWARDAADQLDAIAGRFDAAPRALEQARKSIAEIDALIRDVEDKNAKSMKQGGGGLDNYAALIEQAKRAEAAVQRGLIRNLAEPFERELSVLDRADEALVALDATAADLEARRPPDYRSMVAELAEAGRVIGDGVIRPIQDMVTSFERANAIQELLLGGKEEEAEVQRQINGLIDQYGVRTEEQLQRRLETYGLEGNIRDILADQVTLVRRQGREYEAMQARIQPYLNQVQELRSNIQATIEGALQGRGLFGSVTDFAKGILDSYKKTISEVITEKLFGNLFRDLKDQVEGRNPVQQAGERMATAMDSGSTAVGDLAEAVKTAAASILNTAESMASAPAAVLSGAANDNVSAALPGPTGLLPLIGTITNTFAQHLQRGSAGLDIAAAAGSLIRAPASGKVVTIGYDKRSGNHVVLDHGGGIVSSYSHLLRKPSLGAVVAAGSVIGKVGSTGNSTGPHLHYRVKVDGKDVDPQRFRFPDIGPAVSSANDNLSSLAETVAGLSDAADDAGETIVVTGTRLKKILGGGLKDFAQPGQLSSSELLGKSIHELTTRLGMGLGIDPKSAEKIGSKIGGFVQSAAAAMPYIQLAVTASSMLSDLLGNNNKKYGKEYGFLSPVGFALLGSTLRGSATVTGVGNAIATSGNSASRKQTSLTLGGSIQSTIQQIAEAFGATVLSGSGSVSIGVRKGSYRVDPTGKGITKTSKGALDFGGDADAAVKAAVMDLIRDGMIAGLKAGTQKLLQNAKDLETGLTKAVKFESVFERLKEHLDPVGAALGRLKKEFDGLKAIFTEAGASVEEFAQLEELYGIERKRAIEQASQAMTSALRGLLDDLTINNDALSLRDRLAAARAKYDPLAADLAAGKAVDYDAFAEAARGVEDLMRQIEGSQPGYFTFLTELTALTSKALADQQALIDSAVAGSTPGTTPGTTDPTGPVVGAVDQLGSLLVSELGGHLSAANDNLGTIIRLLTGGGGGGGNSIDFFDRANF